MEPLDHPAVSGLRININKVLGPRALPGREYLKNLIINLEPGPGPHRTRPGPRLGLRPWPQP